MAGYHRSILHFSFKKPVKPLNYFMQPCNYIRELPVHVKTRNLGFGKVAGRHLQNTVMYLVQGVWGLPRIRSDGGHDSENQRHRNFFSAPRILNYYSKKNLIVSERSTRKDSDTEPLLRFCIFRNCILLLSLIIIRCVLFHWINSKKSTLLWQWHIASYRKTTATFIFVG